MSWDKKLEEIIEYAEHHLQRQEELVDPDEISAMAGRDTTGGLSPKPLLA